MYTATKMTGALRELPDSLVAFSGSVIGVNDESVALGGLFDINADWAPPHCSHRRGIDADIRDRVLSTAEARYVKRVWLRIPGTLAPLQEGDHIHLKTSR